MTGLLCPHRVRPVTCATLVLESRKQMQRSQLAVRCRPAGQRLCPGPRTGSLGEFRLCCLAGEGDKVAYFGGHRKSGARKYLLLVRVCVECPSLEVSERGLPFCRAVLQPGLWIGDCLRDFLGITALCFLGPRLAAACQTAVSTGHSHQQLPGTPGWDLGSLGKARKAGYFPRLRGLENGHPRRALEWPVAPWPFHFCLFTRKTPLAPAGASVSGLLTRARGLCSCVHKTRVSLVDVC